MTPAEYIEQRVQGQIAWYDRKSTRNKKWFYIMQSLIITSSALIPLLVGYSDRESFEMLKYAGGALGVVVTILGGIMALKKYRENWRIYRASAESLQREKLFFLNRVEPYDSADDDKNFKLFVRRAEEVMSSENALWASVRAVRTEESDKQ